MRRIFVSTEKLSAEAEICILTKKCRGFMKFSEAETE